MPNRKSLVSEAGLNAPTFSIGRHQLFGSIRCGAGGQTPGFLHAFGVDADDGAHLIAVSRDKGVAQGAGSSTHSNPIRSRARLTLGGGHGDIAAEPDQIVEFQLFGQNPIQLLIAEPTIRYDQDFNIRRQRLGKLHQHTILIGVAMVLQRRLVDGKPHQGRRPAMAADQRQHDRRLVIGIEVGPVHDDNDIRARPDRMGDPSFREFVDVDPRV